MRLQRYLSQSAVASRRQAEELIKSGVVTVNGEVVSEAGHEVEEGDRVEVSGRRVSPEKPIYRLMLKPRACLSNFEDKGERATLRRYLPTQEPGLAVVGPLDFPSEGVILLTTDGELADVMSRRRQTVPMTYHLKLQGTIREEDLDRLSRGWYAEDRPVKPTAVAALATTGKNSWIEVIVAETRPRALKAVGDFLRHTVLKISRIRFGQLSFQGLAMGGWRDLTKVEVAALRSQAGLDEHDPRGVGESDPQEAVPAARERAPRSRSGAQGARPRSGEQGARPRPGAQHGRPSEHGARPRSGDQGARARGAEGDARSSDRGSRGPGERGLRGPRPSGTGAGPQSAKRGPRSSGPDAGPQSAKRGPRSSGSGAGPRSAERGPRPSEHGARPRPPLRGARPERRDGPSFARKARPSEQGSRPRTSERDSRPRPSEQGARPRSSERGVPPRMGAERRGPAAGGERGPRRPPPRGEGSGERGRPARPQPQGAPRGRRPSGPRR